MTITVEAGTDRPEVHLHAGGQGFWVARLAATLGAEVSLCCALGGEPGRVLRGLIEAEPIELSAAAGGTPNGVYIHDRPSGTRAEIVSVDSRPLGRHATDELYGIALAAGLDADVTMITGCQPPDIINPAVYRRLVTDLRANNKLVIADLTGPPLRAALDGGVELLRLSDEELVRARARLAPVIVTMPHSRQGTYRSQSPELSGWVAKRAPLAFALLLDESFDQLLAPALLTLDSLAQRGTSGAACRASRSQKASQLSISRSRSCAGSGCGRVRRCRPAPLPRICGRVVSRGAWIA